METASQSWASLERLPASEPAVTLLDPYGKFFGLRLEGNKLIGKFHNDRANGDNDVVLFKR
jgi:hypothetical protein